MNKENFPEPLKKAVIFGLGTRYEAIKDDLSKRYNVVALADNSKDKIGTVIDGLTVSSPDGIKDINYDLIIITAHHVEIIYQLCKLGVPANHIKLDYEVIRTI